MANNWHYAKGGEKQGPISPAQLKELAKTGQLAPDDLVWREDMKEWRKASSVKGLFPEQSTTTKTPPPPPPSSRVATQSEEVPVWERPAILALLVICCFPVGLFLLWRSPRVSQGQKTLWTGVFAGLFVLGLVVSIFQSQATEKDLARANTLWDEGKKTEAVALYQTVVNERDMFIPDDQKPVVYGRVIDHLAEGGNEEEIERLVQLADRSVPKITPQVETEQGWAALAAGQARLGGDVLSERHFPYERGSTRKMFGDTILGNGRFYAEYAVTHSGDGVITKRMTYHSTVKDGKTVRLPLIPERSEVRRVRDGYVETRSSDFIGKDDDGWTPIIKIGAIIGDSWTGSFEDQRFTFTGYATKRLNDTEVRCAVIEERIDGPVSTRTEFLYSVDHGLVSETVYKIEKGDETYVRSLLLDGLRGDEQNE